MSRNTIVHLLHVPLENDYKHTFWFESPEAQINYFLSLPKLSEYDLSYQRKDEAVKFPKHIDELGNYNYLMYKNSETSDKWVFCFIRETKYINDNRTDLMIETDVIQTYMFDYTVLPSFIEREHVNNDTIGLHTFPESLELGEHISRYNSNVSELQNLSIVVGATKYLTKHKEGDQTIHDVNSAFGGNYGGIYSGLNYHVFPSGTQLKWLNSYLTKMDEKGSGEAIECLFYVPSFISPPERDTTNEEDENVVFYSASVIEKDTPYELTHDIYKNILEEKEGEHTIRNNKLKTFPFQYLLVSNNNGASAVYHFEHFSKSTMRFKIYGCLTPGGSIRLVPCDYKGVLENNEEGLNLGKYPICNWTSDVYTNWLTQNSVNIGLNMAANVGQVIAGAGMMIASGGTAGAIGGTQIIGGVSGIANQLTQIHQMSFTPPQAKGNINCGDVTTATNNNTFTFYGMSIKPEIMSIIDGYFDMFGYKINKIKTPEKDHREEWWYTKTIDVNIDGVIPNNDLQKIKNCYNTGLTFWRNPQNVGRYDLSNNTL